MCGFKAKSFYTSETNTTFLINYTLIEKLKKNQREPF